MADLHIIWYNYSNGLKQKVGLLSSNAIEQSDQVRLYLFKYSCIVVLNFHWIAGSES